MPIQRLSLKAGVAPQQALESLRQAIAGPDRFNTAHDDLNFRIQYVQWAEDVERQLGSLTVDVEVITLMQTARHWQIRNSAGTHLDRLRAQMDSEIEFQRGILRRLAGDLEERIARAQAAPGHQTVIDTNVLLHYQEPASIVWDGIVEADQVRLVVPLRVVEELDGHKYSRRRELAERARRVLPALQQTLGAGGAPGELRENVTIEVPVDPGPRQRPEDADREILDTCHELAQLSGESVSLVSADIAMRLRAEAEGIHVVGMPAAYERQRD